MGRRGGSRSLKRRRGFRPRRRKVCYFCTNRGVEIDFKDVEMMRKFERGGARFVEVPVHHYWRPHGKSQFFRIPHIARAALQLLQLWWLLVDRPRLLPRRFHQN